MHYSLYISLRSKTYLESSLVELGIILQNNESNIVSAESIPVIPYVRLTEGYLLHPELYTQFYSMSDIEVYSRGKIVFEKKTRTGNSVTVINDEFEGGVWQKVPHLSVCVVRVCVHRCVCTRVCLQVSARTCQNSRSLLAHNRSLWTQK